MTSPKPERWDPSNPTPHVCIYCYDTSPHVFLWRYGINYVCQDSDCMYLAKRSPGFVGIFVNLGAAKGRQAVELQKQNEKAVKGAQRGKRRKDERTEANRIKDYRT